MVLKAVISEEEMKIVDQRCLALSLGGGGLLDRSALIRMWIQAGCPVLPETRVGEIIADDVPPITPARTERKPITKPGGSL